MSGVNLSRYWVNRHDINGESRGSWGFNREDDALEFLLQTREKLVKGEFCRLVDTMSDTPVVLRQVDK